MKITADIKLNKRSLLNHTFEKIKNKQKISY